MRGLRVLLFRFLPRRLAPVLLFWEAFQLFKRFRGRGKTTATSPRRLRTAGDPETTTSRRR